MIELLGGAAQPAAQSAPPAPSFELTGDVQQATPGTVYTVNGQMSIRLDRAWTARSYSPAHASDASGRIAPTDRSNQFYIADGEIVNLSGGPLQLTALLQGVVQMGDIRYPCILQCERDEGRALGTSLLPMGKGRLLIACELPEGAQPPLCELHLSIQGASQKLTIRFGS